MGTFNTAAGTALGSKISNECEISELKIYLQTNTYNLATITGVFLILDKDENLLTTEPFSLYLPGETGVKTSNLIATVPKDGFIVVLVTSTNLGAGAANGFYFSAVLNILK